MATEIQKPSNESLTWQKQPEKFLAELGAYLATVQLVYRMQLPAAELVVWRETLKDYSLGELQQAVDHLVRNPPKYEIDGSIQVWRGMPKLPDVVDVMLDFREQRAAEYRRQEGERLAAEMRELEKRRAAHPEEFFGWADVLKLAKEKGLALTRDRSGAVIPGQTIAPKREMTDAEYNARRQELDRQKEKILAKK